MRMPSRSTYSEQSSPVRRSVRRTTTLVTACALAVATAACGGDDLSGSSTASLAIASPNPNVTPSPTPTSSASPTPTPSATATTAVSATLLAALDASLDDERKAIATYEAVIDEFGPVAPFVNIAEAEKQHAAMVEELYETRGLDVPDNSWEGHGEAGDTLVETCLAGVAGEEENIAMYDRLLATLTPDDADVERVFLALQAASRDNHLPAFKLCAGVP